MKDWKRLLSLALCISILMSTAPGWTLGVRAENESEENQTVVTEEKNEYDEEENAEQVDLIPTDDTDFTEHLEETAQEMDSEEPEIYEEYENVDFSILQFIGALYRDEAMVYHYVIEGQVGDTVTLHPVPDCDIEEIQSYQWMRWDNVEDGFVELTTTENPGACSEKLTVTVTEELTAVETAYLCVVSGEFFQGAAAFGLKNEAHAIATESFASSSSIGYYDVNKAVEYAYKYNGAHPNTNYNEPQYIDQTSNGGDCTNFVSQCLVAGGIAESSVWKPYTSAWNSTGSFIRYFGDTEGIPVYVRAGITVSNLKNVAGTEISAKTVHPGDVIFVAGGGNYGHAEFVTRVDSSGVFFCAHSNNKCGCTECQAKNPYAAYNYFSNIHAVVCFSKASDYSYIKECEKVYDDNKPTYAKVRTVKEISAYSLPCSEVTRPESKVQRKLSANTEVIVTRYIKNTAQNYWLLTQSGDWIYAGDVSFVELMNPFSFSGVRLTKSSINVGDGDGVCGVLNVAGGAGIEYTITTRYKKNGISTDMATLSFTSTSVNLAGKVDQESKFGVIPAGEYTFYVTANTTYGVWCPVGNGSTNWQWHDQKFSKTSEEIPFTVKGSQQGTTDPVQLEAPTITVSSTSLKEDEQLNVTWKAAAGADYYEVHIYDETLTNRITGSWGTTNLSYSCNLPLTGDTPQIFTVFVSAISNSLLNTGQTNYYKQSNQIKVTVIPAFDVSINCNGGTAMEQPGKRYYGDQILLYAGNTSRPGYTIKGFHLHRPDDDKWFADGQGWFTEQEIAQKGYTKALYGSNLSNGWVNMNIDMSFLGNNGNTKITSFEFCAVWEELVNLGDDFVAMIAHASSWKKVCNDNRNVALHDDDRSPRCEWHFIRQSDGSYKIVSLLNGLCLDVYNFSSENGTNVQVHDDNGCDAQRWLIYEKDGLYQLAPKFAPNSRLDLNSNDSSEGSNLQIYEYHGERGPQDFRIIPVSMQKNGILGFTNVKTGAGKEFTVSLDLGNNPGIAGMSLTLSYNANVFTLKSATNGGLFDSFSKGLNMVLDNAENVTGDGSIAFLTFTVNENAQEGEYPISAVVRSCVNEDGEDVPVKVNAGTVTIVNVVYGDSNGDEKIDMKDVVLLRKYITNFDYDTGVSSVATDAGADANGDGKIDMKDVVLLRKYITNYDYDTGTSTVVLGPQ